MNTTHRAWFVGRGLLLGMLIVVAISLAHAVYSFNGTCGLNLGDLGSSAHPCTFIEFVSSRNGLLLFLYIWHASMWLFVTLPVLLICVVVQLYFGERPSIGEKR